MEWMLANWDTLVVCALAVVGAASAIVKLTPTPKDDAAVAWVYKVIEVLSLAKKPKV